MKNPRRLGTPGTGGLELGRWVLAVFIQGSATGNRRSFTFEEFHAVMVHDIFQRRSSAVRVTPINLPSVSVKLPLVVCQDVGAVDGPFVACGFHLCGSPKRGLVLVLLGLEIAESGARISPERAGVSGPGGGVCWSG